LTGCETNVFNDPRNCGMCGRVCMAPNATMVCMGGTCQIGSCTPGWGNCNGNVADGCESNLQTDPHNCGSCGRICFAPNATMVCMAGSCQIGSCNPGFGDCDGNVLNGCETSLNTVSNCGACGVTCGVGESCINGVCECTSGICP
jgi:hypothetical protein